MVDRRIKFRHIECFATVHREGSLKRACAVLSLTQPALSKTLKELETLLGATLMQRGRGGVRLTPEGQAFLEGAETSLAALRRGVDGVEALRRGDMATATRLLTRPFAIQGIVQHGDKVGRTIGYPTANIDMGPYLRPAYGIYAVTGRRDDGTVLKGAANLGIRPTFDPPKELLEPYFFDFSGDLYGERIEVALIDYLRPEAKFDSLDALTAQMDADCVRARAVLASI